MPRMLAGVVRYLIAQNCWYLISGFSMLLGCFLMSQAPGADSVELSEGVKLQSVVWLYQFAVVGLAVFVRRKLKVENDAFSLACVAMVLLLDPTVFSERFWGHSRSAGAALNAAGLLMSAGLLVLLREAGKFPLSRRDLAAWLATLTLVYGAGAGFEPGDPGQNSLLINLLALAPIGLAMLASPWQRVEAAGSSEAAPDASLCHHPVLWGSPGTIYRAYLAALVFGYPVLATLRHLDSLSVVFAESLRAAQVAPMLIAGLILLVKAAPNVVWVTKPLAAVGLFAAWLASGQTAPDFPMLQLLLGANIAFGLWTHGRRGLLDFPAHAGAAAVLLTASMTSGGTFDAIASLHVAPLSLAVLLGVLYAAIDGGFWEVWSAGGGLILLALRLSGLPQTYAAGALVHGLALEFLLLAHLYPRKDLTEAGPGVALLMLLSLSPGAHSQESSAWLYQSAVGFELALFLAAGCLTKVRGYLVPCLLLGTAETAGAVLQGLRGVDIARWVRSTSGPVAILFSFATLALGLAGSRQRSSRA